MKIVWQDLPKAKGLFTKRSSIMKNLDDGKAVQHYSANTKIAVVQKAQFQGNTYYRTNSAKEKGLNWAFEASVFGLPNEAAPPAPTKVSVSYTLNAPKPRKSQPRKKQKCAQKPSSPKGGEEKEQSLIKRLLGIFKR